MHGWYCAVPFTYRFLLIRDRTGYDARLLMQAVLAACGRCKECTVSLVHNLPCRDGAPQAAT